MKTIAALLAAAALCAGCASTPPPPSPAAIYDDTRFAAPGVPVDAEAVFALSPAMRAYFDTEIRRRVASRGPQRALTIALHEQGALKLEYDAAITRNAAEAFDARAGNCLSLVIMTAAFAKQLGVPLRYQAIARDGEWSRLGDLLAYNGHVNITLGHRDRDLHRPRISEMVVVDFLAPDQAAALRAVPIREGTVVAMYMNNRAAEVLAEGHIGAAYWWVREALRQDPGFTAAYNTLGVVWLRAAEPARAEAALRHAIAIEPRNHRALANLGNALVAQGRDAEAHALRAQLARSEPEGPLVHWQRGVEAAGRGDWAAARDAFLRELARDDGNAEVQHWLAIAHWRLGDVAAAQRALDLAVQHSNTAPDRKRYAAKREWLAGQGSGASGPVAR